MTDGVRLGFGAGGNGVACLGAGWLPPEPQQVFSRDRHSDLTIPWPAAPLPGGSAGWVLELHVLPVLQRLGATALRLQVRAHDLPVGAVSLTERARFGFIIPAGLTGPALRLRLEHPDAARPADHPDVAGAPLLSLGLLELRLAPLPGERGRADRPRRICFQLANRAAGTAALAEEAARRLGTGLPALLGRFESLLDNSEFGLFQSKCGYEPLGMLRFASAPFDLIADGLRRNFAGLGEAAQMRAELNDVREWNIVQTQYRLRYHTFLRDHQATEAEILAREARKLAFLQRKYLEDLADGRKYFVVRRYRPLRLEDVLPVYMALQQHGACRLLYIVLATPTCPVGTVEEVLPGLYRGFIDRLPTADVLDKLSVAGWLEICAAAWMLAEAAEAAPPDLPPPESIPLESIPAPAPAPAPATLVIGFGAGGDAKRYQRAGWSLTEPEQTFCIDHDSTLQLPALAAGGPGAPPGRGWYLEFTVSPFLHADTLPAQRLTVRVNDVPVGFATLTGRARLGFAVPGWIGGAALQVALHHPDAARPSDITGSHDTRRLAFAVAQARLTALPADPGLRPRAAQVRLAAREAGPAAAELQARFGLRPADVLAGFESLGDNCEFGLMQRRFGYEPLGLLRFSGTELIPLADSLRDGFADLGAAGALWTQAEGHDREWMVYERRHRLRYHTHQRAPAIDADGILRRERRKLGFLRRKLLEDLAEGWKYFVLRQDTPLTLEQVLPIHAALLQHGANRLLYVVPAPEPALIGTVEEVLPGLFRGLIDRVAAPRRLQELSLAGWLEICTAAWLLRDATTGPPPFAAPPFAAPPFAVRADLP